MPARHVICRGSKVYVQDCAVAREQARAPPLAFVLEEGVPSSRKRISIDKKSPYIVADQFICGTSQDGECRRICIQTTALVIYDQNSIEYVTEDGREFAIGVTKSSVCFLMLVPKVPEGIDVQESRKA